MRANDTAVVAIPITIAPAALRRPTPAPVERLPTLCSSCGLRDVCLPCGLTGTDASSIDQLVYSRRRVRRHETLYRSGTRFTSLYAVRSGFLKSYVVTDDGREQVTGFQMPGEIVGLDGIDAEAHRLNVVALEDTEVCVIPFARLEQMAGRMPALQRQFHRMMSREIVRDQGVMTLLGTMDAEQRVVAFLLSLSQRFAARGYAAAEFMLRMTREEIGSYLGLKLETVSRVFSRLQQSGLIGIRNKNVRLCDLTGLKAVLGRTG